MRKPILPLLLLAALTGAGGYAYVHTRPAVLVLTGIVTTNDVTNCSSMRATR